MKEALKQTRTKRHGTHRIVWVSKAGIISDLDAASSCGVIVASGAKGGDRWD